MRSKKKVKFNIGSQVLKVYDRSMRIVKSLIGKRISILRWQTVYIFVNTVTIIKVIVLDNL
jgi:hypothetical protein